MLELESFYPEVGSIIQFKREELAGAKADDALSVCEELIAAYRLGAAGALLIEYDAQTFRQALAQSGLVRIQMLGIEGATAANAARYQKATRSRALFDSLSSGHLSIAGSIVGATLRTWRPQSEYEEDYLYVQILHDLVIGAAQADGLRMLDRFEAILNGTPCARLAVCRSLLCADQQTFDDGFESLIREWTEHLVGQERSASRNEVEFCADRHIFFEGLAILALAQHLGLHSETEYRFCPSEARIALTAD